MGLQVGCDYVLSGHSERRAIFGDSDEDVNAKTLKILKQGMKCILCIGELKEVRATPTLATRSPPESSSTCTARTHARAYPCVRGARAC